jgi:hypothetical protein|tara:strand:- start:985 stop:1755 length:771 start_codon:yes stop_codon:yes gene_type:complete
MIIARLIKPETSLYGMISKLFAPLIIIEKFEVISWFAPWTILAAGMAAKAGMVDRHTFWEFSGWNEGMISLTILIIAMIILKINNHSILLDKDKMGVISEWVLRCIFFLICWILGWGITDILSGLGYFLGYLPMFFGIFLLYFIELDDNTITLFRRKIGVFSSILFLLSCFCGWLLDDPVLATASIVMVPFTLILAVTTHSRHIQRSHIYPLFIIIGFVIARQGWFLFPVLILFYLLRFYNYFIYKNIFPGFAVDH